MSKYLCRFFWDYGRQGVIQGLFIAKKKEIKALIGKEVYFGEILGKHSEVYGKINKKDITFITKDKKVIEIINEYDLLNGYNPLDFYQCKECGEEASPLKIYCHSCRKERKKKKEKEKENKN
jgi:hypothetical protein